MKWVSKVLTFLFAIFCATILALTLRGLPGNPTSEEINTNMWKDNGPLELSPERGRYALTYSYIENNSFHFSLPIARFATPDLGYKDGNYVSLFAPGVSFLVAPGYIAGKYLGASQVGTYAVVSIFALINVLLIRNIAMYLGARPLAATLGGMTFLFASPAFAYAVSLYQHHISTFLILASLYILLRFNNLFSLVFIWLLCAASVPIDYPNVFLMFPIGVAALAKILVVNSIKEKVTIHVKFLGFLTFVGAILPILFFFWFNQQSYNNPLQFSGTVASVKEIDTRGLPTAPKQLGTDDAAQLVKPEDQNKSAVRFFQTRYITNGLATHFINRDRGMIWYTPVMLLSILGMMILYKKRQTTLAIMLGVIGANVLLYSMWGDPYGGWAFGSRYLIPSYALFAILIALALSHWRKNVFLVVAFIILFVYSTGVNTLGAITSNRNPPKAEVLGLEKLTGREEKFGYDRNWQFLQSTGTKSYLYTSSLYKFITPLDFYYSLVTAIAGVGATLLLLNTFITKKEAKYAV